MRGSWKTVAGLLLLCLLWSVDSLRSALFPHFAPRRIPILESETFGFILFALTAGMFSVARRAPWPRGRQIWTAAAVGLGLFALPAVLLSLAQAWISGGTRVAIFSLAPLFAVVLEPHLNVDPKAANFATANPAIAQPPRAGLLGALAAVAGALCVFPLQLPASIGAFAATGAVILATASIATANCLAVQQARALQTKSIAPMAAIAGATAAVVLAIACAFTENAPSPPAALLPELAHAAAVDLPGLLLLFWLMRRISAARMMTRFVLAPLFTILIALVLAPAQIGLRGATGLLLIAAGAAWLVFAPAEEPNTGSLSLID
jgi:drug/metabolite transporter (DMT)-like permease